LPPKNGDTCVFRSKKDNVDMTATVKVLVRSNEQSWFVRQHNPPKKFELRRSEWQDAHTVVGNYSRH
jgi:hypothetical protein